MARTLKSTGIATNLITLVFPDTDHSIVEWKSYSISLNSATTGTTTWKGTTLGYWTPDADSWISYSAGPSFSPPFTVVFLMIDGVLSTPGDRGLMDTVSQNRVVRDGNASQVMALIDAGGAAGVTATTFTATKSYSLGFQCRSTSGTNNVYYGLESGSAATDATTDNGGTIGGAETLTRWGHINTRGIYVAKYVLCALFDKLLSEAEFQSIHDDPVGTFFESGASAAEGGGMLLGSRRNRLTIP